MLKKIEALAHYCNASCHADITVLDRDILSIPKSEIRKIQVDMTIVEGKIAYRRE